MNFRNWVWRGRHTPCCLLLCLARVGRTHLAFQTGTIYTPPSPQWCVPLPTPPPTVSAGSLPGQSGGETPVLCGAGRGWLQGGHFLLLTHEAAVLPACSSSPKALLPLVPWCWNLSPAHGTFHPQVTYSKSKPLDERLGFGYPRLVSMLCSKNGAGNSMWKKEGVRPGILAKCGLWDKSTREASQQAWSASFLLAKETGQVEVRSSLPIPLNLFS